MSCLPISRLHHLSEARHSLLSCCDFFFTVTLKQWPQTVHTALSWSAANGANSKCTLKKFLKKKKRREKVREILFFRDFFLIIIFQLENSWQSKTHQFLLAL